MPYTVNIIVSKPANAVWFKDVNKQANDADIAFVKAQPGFVSWKLVSAPDVNNYTTAMVFEDKAKYDAMMAARAGTAAYQARLAHRTASGMTITIQPV